jgi:dipeptidyl aminopeptidase/acylaminoacyl peptidase
MTGMAPSDVYELTGVTDLRVSPDGRTVAFAVSRIDGEANDYRGRIWLAAADGSTKPRAFTSGSKRDAEPCWSPDGSTLAFTSNRDDGKTMQLFIMPVAGGEPRRLTDLKENVTQPAWSPDGATIAFVARVRDAAYDEVDDRRRRPRRFTRLQFKLDHVGWTADRPQHLFTVRADGSGAPVQITDGDFEDTGPQWSPDGTTIAFISARHAFWDTEHVTDIYLVAAGGGEPRRLTQGGGSFDGVSWSPDGAHLAGQRYPAVFDDPRHTQIAVVDAATGDLRLLTGALDRNCSPYPPAREPVWDGQDIVFLAEDRGNTHVFRVAADGAREPRRLVAGERVVTAYDLVGGRLAFAATSPNTLSELFVAELPAGEASVGEASVGERQLTHAGDVFAAGRELMAAERFTAVSRDGTEVEAWVMRPAGFEAGRTYPALLNIHGGPFTQYGNTFFDEFQVYCGGGYAVVFANPRGSSGYSEAWGRAIRGPGETGPGWGSVDADDCLAVIDEAVRRFDFIDGERLGVIGGSYGGFMTSWLVAHTDRFKAAVSERAVNQWVSMWGSSDFGWDFRGYFGKFLFEDVDAYLRVSPATYAPDIHTPLLILHSENDLRCPIEQGEQLFTTLRLLRREVELVRFPEESHELTRSGSPLHRVQRFELVLEWFDRYLK